MTDTAFLDLQNPAGLERVHVRGQCGGICPASSHDADQGISIKVEVPSDAEAEEDLPAITFPGGIKADPEVSCVPVLMLGGFHKYNYPSFRKIRFMNFCYIEQLTFIRSKRFKLILR
jgi:hypothetical protein